MKIIKKGKQELKMLKRSLMGEERIINKKGEGVSLFQGEGNIWRRVSKSSEHFPVTGKEVRQEIKMKKDSESKSKEIDLTNESKAVDTRETDHMTNINTNDDAMTENVNTKEITEGRDNYNGQTNPDYKTRATNILSKGAMPFCPPARRLWGPDTKENISVGDVNLTWPPKDWQLMTPDRRLLAAETMAITLETCFYGYIDPKMSRCYLLDKYNYLILPDSNHHHKENVEIAVTKSRFYTYQVLK